jgi:hypothetical protein
VWPQRSRAWKARPGIRLSRDAWPFAQLSTPPHRPLLSVGDRQRPMLRARGGHGRRGRAALQRGGEGHQLEPEGEVRGPRSTTLPGERDGPAGLRAGEETLLRGDPLASTDVVYEGLRSHNDEDHRVILTRFLAELEREDSGGRIDHGLGGLAAQAPGGSRHGSVAGDGVGVCAGADGRRGGCAVRRAAGSALGGPGQPA